MKTLAFLSMLALAACGPVGFYYKPGQTVAQIERDEVACLLKAEREVPVREITQVMPGRWIPGRKVCPEPGKCYVTRGHMTRPMVFVEDVNLGLRNKVAAMCMADRGYARISLPPCPPEIARAVPPAVTVAMPRRLAPRACVIRRPGGAYQIVNRE